VDKENKSQSAYKFVKIFTTPKMGEIAIIKSILDGEKIPYYIKGENFGTLYGPADGLSSADIMVREDYAVDAKELLKDFISPGSSKERREEQISTNNLSVSLESSFVSKINNSYRNKYLRISTISVLIVLFIIISFTMGRNYFFRMHPDVEKAKYYSDQGKALLDQSNYKEAVRQLKKSIMFNPNLSVAYARLGYAYVHLKNMKSLLVITGRRLILIPMTTHITVA